MRSLILKWAIVVVFMAAASASAKIFVSEVNYLPDGDGPPAFIEFYNSSESNVDLSDWTIGIYRYAAVTITMPPDSIIPAYGFFLVGFIEDESAWKEFSYVPDYSVEAKFEGDSPGGVVLNDLTSEPVDALGWGVVPEGYYEGEPFVLVSSGHSIERKSGSNHNELKGNSYDTGDNLNDCRERSSPQPQNIHSSREYPSLNAEEQSIGYIKAMYDYQQ
jgi:hypothetical protein